MTVKPTLVKYDHDFVGLYSHHNLIISKCRKCGREHVQYDEVRADCEVPDE